MAGKDKKPATKKSTATKTKVTRIVATDDKKVTKPKTATKKTKSIKAAEKPSVTTAPSAGSNAFGRVGTPFIAMGRYFRGAWYELRQVRWPNRRATWSLTAAMLIFTAFFVVLILLLDALFKYLFQLILG